MADWSNLHRGKKIRILFVSPIFPFPLDDGLKVRAHNTLREMMRQGYDVTLVTCHDMEDGTPANLIDLPDIELISVPFKKRLGFTLSHVIGTFLSRKPYMIWYYSKRSFGQKIAQVMAERRHELVYFYSPYVVSNKNDLHFSGVPTVLDSIDCQSLSMKRGHDSSTKLIDRLYWSINLKRWRRIEKAVFPGFNRLVVTAARDAEPLASVVGKNVDVLTNGVDTEYWRPSCEPEELHSIAFVGTMDAFSNSTAAIYFVNDILPLIHKEVPDARFYAIGKNPPPALQRLNAPPKVNVLGRVDDARQFIDKCEVVVSPLLMATGIQNKILEAMALNKPIVSTRIGIGDLMRFLEDEDVALADDKEEFAKRVVALLLHKDLRERTGKRGRLIVRQHYSWNAFGMRLRDVVEREIARNRKME